MRAWWVESPGDLAQGPLVFGERPQPEPGEGQILVEVSVCGVCRTDLHVAQGDLPVHRQAVTPGHQVVGRVSGLGPGATRFARGERVGVAWLGSTCRHCAYCSSDRENLCTSPLFTGWDLDGGYADRLVANEDYAYAIPAAFEDESAAPLLCAGIIGYRALRRSGARAGDRLGIYGFGGSAHLAAQVALFEGCEVHVLTRSADARRLALSLGAASAGDAYDPPPVELDAAILFAPVGELVPVALGALGRGGTLAIAGIHLSDVPPLNYQAHLFQERSVCSVTANTRQDGEELLAIASRIPIRPETVAYPLEEADRALADLANDRFTGAAVLRMR